MTGEAMRRFNQKRKIGTTAPAGQSGGVQHSVEEHFDIRIARDGNWYHEGSLISRKALVKLFSSVLQRDEDGRYWLITPVERGRIDVDDAPFTAVELHISGRGSGQVLCLRTNLDEWVEADSAHPIRVEPAADSDESRPYILVRDRLDALIVRSVYYQLVELAEARQQDGKDYLGVWSKGIFFPLGVMDDAN